MNKTIASHRSKILPEEIPFHFDANGDAGWYASKYFILLLTPVPYLIYHQFTHKKK